MATEETVSRASSLPPPILLYQLSVGHYISRALYLAAKLKLADLLEDGPRRAVDLARATETHPSSLRRVMRLLVSVGVFAEEEDGRFALASLGEWLRSDAPASMRESVMLFTGIPIQDSWKELEYCVRTGEPAFRRQSPTADAFTFMEQDPEYGATFDRAMAAFTAQTAIAVAAAYDFSSFETVLDVGGGNGALLIGILKAFPQLHGIVFDLPRAIDRARSEIAAAGLTARGEAIAGDFFKTVPRGADACMLKHVIHDWNDEKALAILKNCRDAMKPTGTLLTIEGVYPPRIDASLESRGAAANDVNMLVCTGGRQRTEAEFRALYDAAGFKLTRIVPTMARVSVIEGACVA